MTLSFICARLQRELRRYHSTLASAGARDPTLAFDSPQALCAALCDRLPATIGTRDALVRAAIAQQRVHPHPLWPALLTVAFSPMLLALRGRIRGAIPARAPRELDQALVMAFLESIERVALRSNMAARLRSATERAIFRALGREQRRQARTVPLVVDDVLQVGSRGMAVGSEDATTIRVTEARRSAMSERHNQAPSREVA